jgi:hypothetical protein
MSRSRKIIMMMTFTAAAAMAVMVTKMMPMQREIGA